MKMTKEDLYEQVNDIQQYIHKCTVDLKNNPTATKMDLIKAVIKGVDQWSENNTNEELDEEIDEIKRCIQQCSIDLLDDPNTTNIDLIDAAYRGVHKWQFEAEIIIEEGEFKKDKVAMPNPNIKTRYHEVFGTVDIPCYYCLSHAVCRYSVRKSSMTEKERLWELREIYENDVSAWDDEWEEPDFRISIFDMSISNCSYIEEFKYLYITYGTDKEKLDNFAKKDGYKDHIDMIYEELTN